MIRSTLFHSVAIRSLALAALGLVMGIVLGIGAAGTAHADPYRWCAQYSSGHLGGASNCYFMTIEQCRATVSGVGGYCAPNPFYDGTPIGSEQTRRARKRA